MNTNSTPTSTHANWSLVQNNWSNEMNSLCCNIPIQPTGVHSFQITIEHVSQALMMEGDAGTDCQIWFSPLLRTTGILAADVRNAIILSNDGQLLNTGMKGARGRPWTQRGKKYEIEALVNFDRRRISFTVDGDTPIATPLPSSFVGCPLYLHLASSASFIHLHSYSFSIEQHSVQTSLSGVIHIPIRCNEHVATPLQDTIEANVSCSTLCDPSLDDGSLKREQEQQPAVEEDVNMALAEPPEVGFHSPVNGTGLNSTEMELSPPALIESEAIVPIYGSVGNPLTLAASEDVESSTVTEELVQPIRTTLKPKPLSSSTCISTRDESSDWSLCDILLLLFAICFLSLTSAQCFAFVCQQMMS